MKTVISICVVGTIFLISSVAFADTPPPTQAEARAKIEAQVLAQAQVKCAKDGKVALARHVNGAFMISCVSADDPEYKAQQSATSPQQRQAQAVASNNRWSGRDR